MPWSRTRSATIGLARSGGVSLNPVRHIDPLGALVLPASRDSDGDAR